MKEKTYTLPIITISIAIPMAVAYLVVGLKTKVNLGFNTSSLPLFHAILNSTTAILLLASLYFIKNRRIQAHRNANLTGCCTERHFFNFICDLPQLQSFSEIW